MEIRQDVVEYVAAQDARRARRVEKVVRHLATLGHGRFVREAAVMGYVRGTLAQPGERVPPDSAVVAEVVDAVLAMPDLYPMICSLDVDVAPPTPFEALAATMLALHDPDRHPGDGPAATCTSCRDRSGQAVAWPCETVRVLGRVATCANVMENSDGTATPCRGLLVFAPDLPQARCLVCHAWCGRLVADYVDAV